MKKIAILGATGSIGRKTLSVIEDFPDEFEVVGLTCETNIGLLEEQVRRFKPKVCACAKSEKARELEARTQDTGVKVLAGPEGLVEVATEASATMVVSALVGSCGLTPILAAIEAGKQIALATKEALVMAGRIITQRANDMGIKILPIDSEHSAIFQCLEGRSVADVRRIILTGSGGPLNYLSLDDLSSIAPAQALNHPKWKMGQKVSIDSATLMNKGLEVIEARWLFDVPIAKIEVLIHPEAIIHSMVEFVDGSHLAQLGVTDMRLPIQYALSYPKRLPSSRLPSIDFDQVRTLTFALPDLERFPSLALAYEAARIGHTVTAVLNAANEEAVGAYLSNQIKITDIPRIVEKVMGAHQLVQDPTLGQILAADSWAREEARKLCSL